MPVDLMKVVNNPKPSHDTKISYFQNRLTGQGKKVGLFNNTNSILADNITKHLKGKDYYTAEIDLKLNHSKAVILNSKLNSLPLQLFAADKQHTYDTSPMSLISSVTDDVLQAKFKQAPHFLNDIDYRSFQKNANGQELSYGLLVENIGYYHFKNINKVDPELFMPNIDLVLRLTQPHSNKTKVTIIDDQLYLTRVNYNKLNISSTANQIIVLRNVDPYYGHYEAESLQDNLSTVLRMIDFQCHFNFKDPAEKMFNSFSQLSLADSLLAQVKFNQKYLINDLPLLFKFYNNTPEQFEQHRHLLNKAYYLIKAEENNYQEHDYRELYNRIKFQTLNHKTYHKMYQYTGYSFSKLISLNTRLSLTHQIGELADNQDVYQFQPTNKTLQTTDKYSPEQLAIIHSTEPYAVGVAGAGSGKSHTLLGRLSFLEQNNIDFKHVLVTTFTNTAAANIINRFKGGINSLTNANLFHKIYQKNFTQPLTNDSTISNLLHMISPNSKLMKSNNTIDSVRVQLTDLIKKSINTGYQKVDPRKTTENLIALINENLDDVIKILSAIGQTSLLLEPIIINAMMQNQTSIKYPKELNNLDFIITDESQDTSSFEYVLLLQLAHLNNAQIMIIGDANQTLYQFRSANPEFLNALERSDVFKTYTMSTNYRSRQSILNVANEILNVLDTNATAKLQLHANQYSHLDETTFKAQINLENLILEPKSSKKADIRDELVDNLRQRQDFNNWVIDQYNHQHQIAIMAYRNNDTQAIGEAVAQILRDQLHIEPSVKYTRKANSKPNTWLSEMLSSTRDPEFEKLAANGQASTSTFKTSLYNRLLVRANKSRYNKGIVNQWALTQVDELTKRASFRAHLNDLNKGAISYHSFNGFVSLWLIKAETYRNNVNRLLDDTQDTNWQDADIVVSTIHSAKGLEFDSVICYFDETMRQATTQENLRLFGVALTRAKEQELILNRPKLDLSQGRVPTAYGYTRSDMFKTPMRTAYMRVLQNLKNTSVQS